MSSVEPGRSGGSGAPALSLESVVVRFGGVTALDGVGLAVEPGELCGLIGPNGAGKTTLFDVVSGLTRPDSGSVRLAGRDVTGWSPTRRAARGAPPHLPARADLRMAHRGGQRGRRARLAGRRQWPAGRSRRRSRAPTPRGRTARALHARSSTSAGSPRWAETPAGSLPIGAARLVELARAIADRPRVLLLDEPTSGLDEAEADRLGELIDAVRRSEGCAVLLVEHDVGFVLGRCDRVVVLDLGVVLTAGSPEAVRDDPSVRTAYLGSTA